MTKPSQETRDLLAEMDHLSDCSVRTSDGSKFRVHKAVLTLHSRVLG